MASLPPIQSLPNRPEQDIKAALDLLFEPSPALHSLLVPPIQAAFPPFESYIHLIGQAQLQLQTLLARAESGDPQGRETLYAIFGSHPRLGEKHTGSAQSAAEQGQLSEDAAAAEEFARLNMLYEATFPGLRYVVFVNGRSRDEIMANMRERIARGDVRQEERETMTAMCSIAADRARKLQPIP